VDHAPGPILLTAYLLRDHKLCYRLRFWALAGHLSLKVTRFFIPWSAAGHALVTHFSFPAGCNLLKAKEELVQLTEIERIVNTSTYPQVRLGFSPIR
jgi:hypothetical protein